MKKLIITVCVMMNLICCNSSPSHRQENSIENKEVTTENKEAGEELPDSLFYKINMSVFDISSIPYDETIGSQKLKVASGIFYKKVINSIKELKNASRVDLFYLSKQTGIENGFLVTIYTESVIDPGSIYLLSLDRDFNLVDYRKIGYEKCDLDDQTDTCEIVFCETISSNMNQKNDYIIVHKKEKEFNCDSGEKREVDADSTQLIIENQKFFYKKL